VGTKHFENKGRQAWWSVHVDAWRRSGMNRTRYCRLHALNKGTFDRWLKVLETVESARENARKRHKRTREPVRSDRHNKAVQAFWAMHVEALNWSGSTAKDYANAHHISVHSLRTWRARFDAAPLQVDWRARLHPSIRSQISTGVSSAAKESDDENILTAPAPAAPATDGRSNRRSFTDAEKLAIVMEAEQPGVSAAAVCRRHNIATSMIFRWRVQFGFGRGEPTTLATVRIADKPRHDDGEGGDDAAVLQRILPIPPGAVAVELVDDRRVFAPPGSDPEAVRRYIAQQEENTRC
jgi:transposase-like protein